VFSIRALAKDELDALLSLYSHLHAADERPSAAAADDIWQELLSNPRHRRLGAFDGAALISSCALTIVPNLTRGGRPYGLIENVVTHPDMRRRGAASAVLRAALDFAWSQNCYKVVLTTGRTDGIIRAFYTACGFVASERQAFIARLTGRGDR